MIAKFDKLNVPTKINIMISEIGSFWIDIIDGEKFRIKNINAPLH